MESPLLDSVWTHSNPTSTRISLLEQMVASLRVKKTGKTCLASCFQPRRAYLRKKSSIASFSTMLTALSGASMSGDLKNPGKSIPIGTLAGLHLALGTYCLMILSLASTITRQSLYNDV